jgi:hypothetical protein
MAGVRGVVTKLLVLYPNTRADAMQKNGVPLAATRRLCAGERSVGALLTGWLLHPVLPCAKSPSRG